MFFFSLSLSLSPFYSAGLAFQMRSAAAASQCVSLDHRPPLFFRRSPHLPATNMSTTIHRIRRRRAECANLDGILFAVYAGGIAYSLQRRVKWKDDMDEDESVQALSTRRYQSQRDADEDTSEELRWTLMGLVACIPLASWTAFVLGAITSDLISDRIRFGVFAAMYALFPLTHSLDFSEDPGTILAIAFCVTQVSRGG